MKRSLNSAAGGLFEQLQHSAVSGCHVHRLLACFVLGRAVGSMLQQSPDKFRIRQLGCNVQWRVSVLTTVHTGTCGGTVSVSSSWEWTQHTGINIMGMKIMITGYN